MSPSYLLRCTACGAGYQDDGVRLHCDGRHARALLRTEYAQRTLAVDETAGGILRYEAWLPHRNEVEPSGSTAIYRSDALGDFLDLQNLWIAFNGYWPVRGATLPSATFKDIEADAIAGRFPRDGRVLVVASAGNTAAALAQACSRYDVPAVVVVPEQALERLRLTAPLAPNVKIVAIGDDSTYDDAIAFAERVAQLDGFVFEGGTFNVARRDGIGTTLLAFSEAAGELPDYYVQAIGSGAGAIAAHEAALRLIEDGRYGARLPRLLLVQNAPSAPVYEAWRAKSESLVEEAADELTLRRRARGLAATVLGTRVPPYGIAGGIRSILTESGGDVVVATNEQACDAMALFAELEGVDIEPAAGVALAGLRNAVFAGIVPQEAVVVLHVTGGGRKIRNGAFSVTPLPALTVPLAAVREPRLAELVAASFNSKEATL